MDVLSHSEKVKIGQKRGGARGRFPGRPVTVTDAAILRAIPLGTTCGAKKVGLSVAQFIVRRRRLEIVSDNELVPSGKR